MAGLTILALCTMFSLPGIGLGHAPGARSHRESFAHAAFLSASFVRVSFLPYRRLLLWMVSSATTSYLISWH